MSWRKPPPPPPREPAESGLLLRALGDLQEETGRQSVTELDILAAVIGRNEMDLPEIINQGIDAGYIKEDITGAISLTEKGWRWYERDEDRRR